MKYNWMAIGKIGKWVDKHGQEVNIDDKYLDDIISATKDTKEVKFVIDHPRYDKIGFGSPSLLKRVGELLFALPDEVNEDFKKAVNKGELPGRSMTLDKKTKQLLNISFLPENVPPAIPLPAYEFSNGNDTIILSYKFEKEQSHFADLETNNFEFAQYEVSSYPFKIIKDMINNFRDFVIEKFGLETADKSFPKWMIDEIGTPPALYEVNDETKTNLNNPSFSQNTKDTNMNIDLSKLTPEQLAAFQTLENKITSLATELNNKTVELSAEKTTQLKNEVLQFCSADAKLKITPADKDKAVAFLMSQKNAGSQGVIEFSTADDTKVKFNAFEFAKELIMKLPDVIELSEMATNGTGKSASQQDIEYNAGIEAAKRINSNN